MMIRPIPQERRSPHIQTVLDSDKVECYVVSGVEGPSLAIADHRVAGPKPWGGGKIMHKWTADKRFILLALGLEDDGQPEPTAGFARHEKLSTQIREAVERVIRSIRIGDLGRDLVATVRDISPEVLTREETP